MGVTNGCGCKEVYRFPHTTYPYSSCICSFFAAASLLFVHFFNVFRSLYIYDRVCVCACIYMYMCMHLYPCEFAFVYMHKRKRSLLRTFACVRLRVCLRAELIKRKIFQQANALWVQKLSGCTIYLLAMHAYAFCV